jgi:hypothetical protein
MNEESIKIVTVAIAVTLALSGLVYGFLSQPNLNEAESVAIRSYDLGTKWRESLFGADQNLYRMPNATSAAIEHLYNETIIIYLQVFSFNTSEEAGLWFQRQSDYYFANSTQTQWIDLGDHGFYTEKDISGLIFIFNNLGFAMDFSFQPLYKTHESRFNGALIIGHAQLAKARLL